jgi:hypothetical protein
LFCNRRQIFSRKGFACFWVLIFFSMLSTGDYGDPPQMQRFLMQVSGGGEGGGAGGMGGGGVEGSVFACVCTHALSRARAHTHTQTGTSIVECFVYYRGMFCSLTYNFFCKTSWGFGCLWWWRVNWGLRSWSTSSRSRWHTF